MDKEVIIDELLKMAKNWHDTEKLTGENIWGECATDLDNLIENIAEQM